MKDRDYERLRGPLFSMFGGRGDITGEGDLSEQLRAIGGSSARTRSGVNITAAAAKLGLSVGTVRGWVNQGTHPSGKSARKVRTTARRIGRTKAGRAQAVAVARAQGAFTHVTSIDVTAVQGPTRSGADYTRERTVNRRLTPEQVEQMAAAYEAGGDRAVMAWVDEEMQGYLPGWGIESTDTPGGGLSFRTD